MICCYGNITDYTYAILMPGSWRVICICKNDARFIGMIFAREGGGVTLTGVDVPLEGESVLVLKITNLIQSHHVLTTIVI